MKNKFKIFLIGVILFGKTVPVFAQNNDYYGECRKEVLGEVNYMTDKYLEWLEKKTKAKSTVSVDILPLIYGKEVKKPVTDKPNPEVLGMLNDLEVDFNLLCYNARLEESFLEKCQWQKYMREDKTIVTLSSVKSVWDYCSDLTHYRLRDLRDFTELELLRDAAEEKTQFVMRKYKHIVENIEKLAKDITYTKYYIATMAEMVDCFAIDCVP